MPRSASKPLPASDRAAHPARETWQEQIASFVGFFIYLLILKSFFLPLFIIPTGSMAEALYGEHAVHTCPNCGIEYAVGWQQPDSEHWPAGVRFHPRAVQCPNCRWVQFYPHTHPPLRPPADAQPEELLRKPLRPVAGDRIFVHGWNYDHLFANVDDVGPARWDAVVFKVPNDGQTNYIKRLIGLPGETIEFIDGDLFVDGQIARKTPQAQHSLWFPYYNHDYPPRRPASRARYHPRWVAQGDSAPWVGLDTRVMRFDDREHPHATIQFITAPHATPAPGQINDLYAYNAGAGSVNVVNDVRLSAEIQIEDGDGYVELSTTKYNDRFCARLYADGRLTLEHEGNSADGERRRVVWQQENLPPTSAPRRLALSSVDYVISVLVDGEPVLTSTPEQLAITPERARKYALRKSNPVIRIAAERVAATVRHVLIERDIYYTSDPDRRTRQPPNAGTGNPLTLGPDEYFGCGDNSPNSLDGRYWYRDMLGPHLREAADAGTYQPGTVPADQLIGPAFFVYWPGFLPVTSQGPNLLPDIGRARWVR